MFPTKTLPNADFQDATGPEPASPASVGERAVTVPLGPLQVPGMLVWPDHPSGLVLVAQDRGGKPGPVELGVAQELRRAGLATLHLDLLQPAAAAQRAVEPEVLARRLLVATAWAQAQPEVQGLVPGYLASGGASAAALKASVMPDSPVRAAVCLAGRPELAGDALAAVRVPTLLLTGSRDHESLEPTRLAFRRLDCVKRLVVLEGASLRVEEPGAVEEAGRWAAGWLVEHLVMAPGRHERRRYRSPSWSPSPRF